MKQAIGYALLAGAAALWGAVPAAQTSSVHQRIAAAVGRIRLADTHEHLPPEPDRLKAPVSLFSLLRYVSSDLWADGYWTEAEALTFARAVLREDALRTFKLGL